MSTSAERLRRTVRWLQAYAALLTIAVAVLFVRSGTATNGVLRAQGLIIEDEVGRERILIGAPVPEAANRVRTDEARVREVWAPRFPEAYMDYYQDYSPRHQRDADPQRGRIRSPRRRGSHARSEHRQAYRAEYGHGDQRHRGIRADRVRREAYGRPLSCESGPRHGSHRRGSHLDAGRWWPTRCSGGHGGGQDLSRQRARLDTDGRALRRNSRDSWSGEMARPCTR